MSVKQVWFFKTESIIMTTKPNKSVDKIHDRMALILRRKIIKDWITDWDFERNYLKDEITELIRTKVAKIKRTDYLQICSFAIVLFNFI